MVEVNIYKVHICSYLGTILPTTISTTACVYYKIRFADILDALMFLKNYLKQ